MRTVVVGDGEETEGVEAAEKISFLCPRDESQGALRFAPVCPSVCLSVRLSVCPSVRHALRYRVCVINSSHSL